MCWDFWLSPQQGAGAGPRPQNPEGSREKPWTAEKPPGQRANLSKNYPQSSTSATPGKNLWWSHPGAIKRGTQRRRDVRWGRQKQNDPRNAENGPPELFPLRLRKKNLKIIFVRRQPVTKQPPPFTFLLFFVNRVWRNDPLPVESFIPETICCPSAEGRPRGASSSVASRCTSAKLRLKVWTALPVWVNILFCLKQPFSVFCCTGSPFSSSGKPAVKVVGWNLPLIRWDSWLRMKVNDSSDVVRDFTLLIFRWCPNTIKSRHLYKYSLSF